jgi:hypothetical protein
LRVDFDADFTNTEGAKAPTLVTESRHKRIILIDDNMVDDLQYCAEMVGAMI